MSSPALRHISKLGGYDLMLVFAATHNVRCADSVPKNSQPTMVIIVSLEDVWQDLAIGFKRPIIGNGKVYYLHTVIDFLSRWPGVAVVK